MNTQETFKKVLEGLGFANHKPSQMTNSDYWLCTNTAMEQYAKQEVEADRNRCKIVTDNHLLKRIKELEDNEQKFRNFIRTNHLSKDWEKFFDDYNNKPSSTDE